MMFIKTTFTLLYLISNLYLVTGLQCTNCNDAALTFNNAAKLPTECEGKFLEADVCLVLFRMNYLTKEIYLNLTGTTVPIGNYHLELFAQNKFDEPKRLGVNITYTCNTSADCAKLFYQLNIQKLIQNEPILNEIQANLFDPTILNVQQCADKQDQPVTCENGYGCHGYKIIEDGITDYYGECRNASTITIFPRAYFDITLVQSNPPILSSDWDHIGFTCNKQNLCNSRQQIDKMVKLANNFYHWEFVGPIQAQTFL